MATIKPNNGQLPPGYVSPFQRVPMEERIDDALACCAMLTSQSLADIKKLAIQHGFPPHGPAWVDNQLIAKICYQHGLVSSDYKHTDTISALPNVALLLADYNPRNEIGRHVLWHHIRGTAEQTAFHYVVDPAGWLDPKHHITTDFKHLKLDQKPIYYIEVTQRPDMTRKSK